MQGAKEVFTIWQRREEKRREEKRREEKRREEKRREEKTTKNHSSRVQDKVQQHPKRHQSLGNFHQDASWTLQGPVWLEFLLYFAQHMITIQQITAVWDQDEKEKEP
ncbi:hypothetical protein HGM15179_016150 [Zosterops borbonicus]|uniref:Uncharacterized protein n=1 Tax=Zosterops borbonicus TaxID=364589 RepID=A0A8K1G3P5_9PASS|nr:hypothetical protein HGM15179_016150 [Zosterops borbonicus]